MVLNGMLTCEASRLCPHNPAGFAAEIHIALPLVEEDATRPHRSISWGIALAKEAYHDIVWPPVDLHHICKQLDS